MSNKQVGPPDDKARKAILLVVVITLLGFCVLLIGLMAMQIGGNG